MSFDWLEGSSKVLVLLHFIENHHKIITKYYYYYYRFGILIGLQPNTHSKDLNQTCQKVLRLLADSGGWKIGKTKVHWNL